MILKPSHKFALVGAGLTGLLLLNVRRDVSRILDSYTWQPVTRRTLHRVVSAPGVMEAANVANIKSDVEEIALKKYVREGQAVSTGQLLIELSRSRTQLEYQQKKNALSDAEADCRKATRELGLQEKLFRDRAVSRSQVEDAARAKQKSFASRDIAAREFALEQKKLDGTMVRSPIDGVVLKDFTTVGQPVSVGKDIITVGDTSHFLVRAKVDELDIQHVRIGEIVDIKADAYPDQTLQGVVRAIATQAERETFAKVEAVIDITDAKGLSLKHNLSVRVDIRTEDIPDAIGISVRAVQKKEGNLARVLVRNRFNLVRRRIVTLGKPAGDDVEVRSGLAPGDQIGLPQLVNTPQ